MNNMTARETTYYLNLFSPETFETFLASTRTTTGFRSGHRALAARVSPRDRFICYVTRVSRWAAVLEVVRGPYDDDRPLLVAEQDPFTVRFDVRPIVCLDIGAGLPIKDDELWTRLSFTRDRSKGNSAWTGGVRSSLLRLKTPDAVLLERSLLERAEGSRVAGRPEG